MRDDWTRVIRSVTNTRRIVVPIPPTSSEIEVTAASNSANMTPRPSPVAAI
jgi:hypothetical protein